MGIHPDVYHCNEGHASFINIERIQNLVKTDNLSFDEAIEVVRASTLFTTHTSVPAANDMFSEDLLRKYLGDKANYFNIDWSKFIGLGRLNADDRNEKFSMTFFGARISQEINAVSKIHQKVSRNLLNPLWKNYKPAELHIGNVTNGVHYGTWASRKWQQFYSDTLGVTLSNITDKTLWTKINDVPGKDLWDVHLSLKRRLVNAIKGNSAAADAPDKVMKRPFNAPPQLSENALIIGFARRFVPYKRSSLIFTDLQRLARILSDKERPVIFLFSGKAHPMDQESIRLIGRLIEATSDPELKNSIIFLEGYNMDIARLLVQGVDVWLNTPYRHTEASGTSGMKAAMNGVLNFSVLDGWWAEAYNGNNGWMLSEEPLYSDYELQNQADAVTIYDTLENEIIPLFYDKDKSGVPAQWVSRVKSSLASIVPQFNMQRVLKEYDGLFYDKLFTRVGYIKVQMATAGPKPLLPGRKKCLPIGMKWMLFP